MQIFLDKLLKQFSGELPDELFVELKGIPEGTSGGFPSETSIEGASEWTPGMEIVNELLHILWEELPQEILEKPPEELLENFSEELPEVSEDNPSNQIAL